MAGIDFKLTAISSLFLGDQEDAVAQAMMAYTNAYITLQSAFTSSADQTFSSPIAQTLIPGTPVTPLIE